MNFRPLNILCADDESSVCEVLNDYFTDKGHTVDIADNGVFAYYLISARNYDLVYMDLSLPVMNGLDCIRAIREQNKSVYIVVMSGRTAEEASQGLRYGANAFMAKPFNLAMLDKDITAAFAVLKVF